jgi:tRNA-Thr(GGU) m(6)t(6)A37 methyltransferase TsaA
MDDSAPDIVLRPIGRVRTKAKEQRWEGWDEVASEIVIDEGLAECLDGLEQFSHIIVIYWMHGLAPARQPVAKIHPRGRADLPLVGVLSTRTRQRPNPLGVTTARLVERKGNVLKVVGLDALDGTPVIDIKPYMPHYDSPPDAKEADWVQKLR